MPGAHSPLVHLAAQVEFRVEPDHVLRQRVRLDQEEPVVQVVASD